MAISTLTYILRRLFFNRLKLARTDFLNIVYAVSFYNISELVDDPRYHFPNSKHKIPKCEDHQRDVE